MKHAALLLALAFVASCDGGAACSAIGSGTFGTQGSNPIACGNGKVEGTEACDDGNNTSGDGCSSACVVEAGYFCTGAPSTCTQGASLPSVTLLDFNPAGYTLTSPTREPLSTSDLVARCIVGAGPWNCTCGAAGVAQIGCTQGQAVAVTQGTGTTTVALPWGSALKAVNAAKAPKITTPSAWETYWTGPHAVIVYAYATTITSSVPFELSMVDGGSTNGFQMRGNDNGCIWYKAGATPASISVGFGAGSNVPSLGFGAYGCRKTATGASSVYDSFADGAKTTSSAWPNDPGAPTGGDLWFARNAGGSAPLDGALFEVDFYNAAPTDARMQALTAPVQAGYLVAADGTTLIDHTSGPTVFYVDPVTGLAWPYGNNTANVNASGIAIEERNDSEVGGAGCNWAADCLDASSWTDVGTPTVTTNVASGPFSAQKNTAEADEIVDDDAAAFEGKSATTSCDNAVDHDTASCYLGLGTTGTTLNKARLDWVVTGGGTATPSSCDFTITGTGPLGYDLYQCPTVTSGTVTTLKARLLVGNAVSDTGSIRVSQCQCDRQARAQDGRMITSTGEGRDLYHVPAATTATMKSAGLRNNGTLSVIFTLNHDAPGDEISDAADSWFPFDLAHTGNDDHRITLFYEVLGGYNHQLCLRLDDGTHTNVDLCSPTGITFTHGVQTIVTAQWTSCDATHVKGFLYRDTCANSQTCQATTLIASDTTCTLKKPADDVWGQGFLGNRMNATFGMNGRGARWKLTTP